MAKTIITGTLLGVEDVREVNFNGQTTTAGYVRVSSDGFLYLIRAWGKKIDLARQFIGQYADVLVEIIPRTQINQEKHQIFANCELKMTALAITKPKPEQTAASWTEPPPAPRSAYPFSRPAQDDDYNSVKPFGKPFQDWDRFENGRQ